MHRKNKILIFSLFSLLFIFLVIFMLNTSHANNYEMDDYKDLNLSNMNNSVLIYSGEVSEWDESIREIGNIVYNPKINEYLFFYSGNKGEYNQNNVFIGMAYSKDGLNWEKYGKILDLSAEDPYVIIYNNTFYMFFEDKEEVPFKRISLAKSSDGREWEIVKKGVLNPVLFGWQSQDVSSPIILRYDNNWIMLYEGRGFFNQGKIGYATSNDLINWDKKCLPVFSGESYWDNHVVPDDIVLYKDNYILSYHGYDKKLEGWQSGLAISNDLKNWKILTEKPISDSDTIMMIKDESQINFIEEGDKEVNLIYMQNE